MVPSKSSEDAAGHVRGYVATARIAAKKKVKRLEVSIWSPESA